MCYDFQCLHDICSESNGEITSKKTIAIKYESCVSGIDHGIAGLLQELKRDDSFCELQHGVGVLGSDCEAQELFAIVEQVGEVEVICSSGQQGDTI